jgi:hypothetical protein
VTPAPLDTLATLQSLGLELPSPAYLFAAIVFGLVGLAAFRLGRKRDRPRTMWLGVALMLYPYLVSNTAWLVAIGAALCAGLWLDRG